MPFLLGAADLVRDAPGPDGHAHKLIRIQDGTGHRCARDVRTASAIVESSRFAGTFFVLPLI